MNLKFFLIGIVLLIAGVLVFVRTAKKQTRPQDKFEMLLSLVRGLFVGENYSLGLLLAFAGIVFVFYSFKII